MARQANKVKNDAGKSASLNQLKTLLSKTEADVCKKWASIKANDEEIQYKKANIDPKYEYFTAKTVLFTSSDDAISKWAADFETAQIMSSEFQKKIRSTFTKKESKELWELKDSIHRKIDADGGYSYAAKVDNNPDQFIKYQQYQIRLEKIQCDFWKAPYELISDHCHHQQHDDF